MGEALLFVLGEGLKGLLGSESFGLRSVWPGGESVVEAAERILEGAAQPNETA